VGNPDKTWKYGFQPMYAYIGLGLHQTRLPHEFIGGSSLPSAPVRKYPPIHRPSPLPGKFLSLMGNPLHPQLARDARTPRHIPHPSLCPHLTARAPVNRGLSYNPYKLIYFETAANGVFTVNAYTCGKCQTQFREYFSKTGKHRFTLKLEKVKGYMKA
jgi:hypothetical protein